MSDCVTLSVSGISLPLDAPEEEAFRAAAKLLAHHRLLAQDDAYEFHVGRRAVDARRRQDVHFVYTVTVTGQFSLGQGGGRLPAGVSLLVQEEPIPSVGKNRLSHRPVVVGSGPAGLFAALLLAEQGYRPLLLERGGDVAERTAAVTRFYETRQLDTRTNIQFGAGGAGTFSDGKLITRVSDPYGQYVLRRLVEFGAPEDILWQARPHVGTDYLRRAVTAMLARIRALGGQVRFHTLLQDISLTDGRLTGMICENMSLPCDAMVLAVGHSARDTYAMLMKKPLLLQAKPFSVGMRIEHLQADMDAAMYGDFAGHPRLPHAEYAVSAHFGERGIYSFCMCPGGEVMAAASEAGGLVVNGMSYRDRGGRNANAALAVSVLPEDFGATPEGAIAFQRRIEQAAFRAGGGDYTVPLCTVGDLLSATYKTEPRRITPTYMGGEGTWRVADPASFLPPFVVDTLRRGMAHFGRRTAGFDAQDALLSGAETRTSAPIRILRGDNREAIGCSGLYPCGEGAGYAGGITSAALDGLRSALALMAAYGPSDND